MAIDVFIVDDQPDLRSLLEQLVLSTRGLELSGSCATATEALLLIPDFKPRVVLMDIYLGSGQSGIDCIRTLKPMCPSVLFLVNTIYEEDEQVFDALRAGAHGYLLKSAGPEKMIESIRECCDGGAPMNPQIARKLLWAFQDMQTIVKEPDPADAPAMPLTALSPRENEILRWLSRGLLYKEIAACLFISPETVRKHVYHIYEKLHVGNRIEAINKYFRRE